MIGIIIPVYNHSKALAKALSSIEKQTYKDIEIIVVDDGSEAELPIFNFQFSMNVVIQTHRGAAAARNRGFAEAKGEYVIFWDADVIGKPDMLEKMLGALAAHPEASYAYCNYKLGWKRMPAREFDAEALKKNNYIMTTSLLRRADFHGFDESLKRFQDWDLWLALLEKGKRGAWIPEYLFRVIPRRGGISRWLPSFAYRAPWRRLPWVKNAVEDYEAARELVLAKHKLARNAIR